MPQFVQLDAADCNYLLTLIAEMDSDTPYTARQRSYTVPKLQKIKAAPDKNRLAFQDTEYLLDLTEDDTLPETEQQRLMTQQKLQEILEKQQQSRDEQINIEEQRAARRSRREGLQLEELAKHFSDKHTR